MRYRFSCILLPALAGILALLTACGGPEAGTDEAEKRHPDVKEARALVRQQDLDGAAEVLYAVLREDPSMAYAHMQLGFVFQSKQEPVKTLYHFQRYLEMRPDTENAQTIRELVEDELKRLALRVAPDPAAASASADGTELRERLRETQRELALARVELQQLRLRTGENGDRPPADWAREKLELLEEIERLRSAESVSAAGSPPIATPDESAARRYTVQRGDTLSGIANKMYGRSSQWRKIYDANRDVLPSTDRLKPGMELRIPQ